MMACVHHWIIDSPSGAQSEGRCRHCGEARMFDNVGPVFGPGDAPHHMVPTKAEREMKGNERVAMQLVFAGHTKQRVGDRF